MHNRDDPLWPRDVSVLWRRPKEFFPTRDHTDAERINALVRFSLYAALAAALVSPTPARVVAIGVVVAAVLTFVASSSTASPANPPSSRRATVGSDTTAGKHAIACRRPTKDNPFMNTPTTEFGQPNPRACRYADVQDDVVASFDDGLVREVTDVYHNRASDRQFVTVPVPDAVPDTLAFRNFLFSNTAAAAASSRAVYKS